MEMENRTMRMLLQSMPRKGFILTFVVFTVLFLVCIIIGAAAGPHVYDTRSVSAYNCPVGVTVYDPNVCDGVDLAQNNSRWTGEIRNLDKLNQELLLIATIQNKIFEQAGVEKSVMFSVDIAGRNADDEMWTVLESADDVHSRRVSCAEGNQDCTGITIAHQVFIKYSSYQFNVSILNPGAFLGDVTFTFSFIDHNYTLFELWFRFVFLVITFVIVILYAHRLRTFSWPDWTIEQKWAAVLLFGLMAYDNPFFPLEILVEGWFPIFLNRLLYGSFIVLLLLFWLLMFDGLRKESSQRTFVNFYLPKVLLLGFFWIAGITAYTWGQLQEVSDPAFNSGTEMPGILAFQIIMLILLIIYVFWLVVVICRSCGDSKLLPYLGVRVKFFGIFTLLVILTVLGGLIFGGIFGSSYNNAAEFTSFLALFNLYCYTLAFVYLPSNGLVGVGTRDRIGMVRLEDEDVTASRSSGIEMDAK